MAKQPGTNTEKEELEQFIIFILDNEEYAVPIAEVKEIQVLGNLTPVPNAPGFVLGIINIRGQIIVVIDLEKRLALSRQTERKEAPHVLIIEAQETNYGVLVDKVAEVLKIPREAIKKSPELISSKINAEFIKGVALLKSGSEKEESERVILIIDLTKILSQEELETVQENTK